MPSKLNAGLGRWTATRLYAARNGCDPNLPSPPSHREPISPTGTYSSMTSFYYDIAYDGYGNLGLVPGPPRTIGKMGWRGKDDFDVTEPRSIGGSCKHKEDSEMTMVGGAEIKGIVRHFEEMDVRWTPKTGQAGKVYHRSRK